MNQIGGSELGFIKSNHRVENNTLYDSRAIFQDPGRKIKEISWAERGESEKERKESQRAPMYKGAHLPTPPLGAVRPVVGDRLMELGSVIRAEGACTSLPI